MSNLEEKKMIEFFSSIRKLNGPRKHKVSKSLGVYDAYKYIRKHKWLNIGQRLTEHEFYSIIRTVNNYLAEELANGNDITLPQRMGRLEIRKHDAKIKLENGKVKTNLPIDWDATLKLWYEDKESFNNKTLIRMEEKEIFKVYYNKAKADYTNKSFIQFDVNREIKKKLKHNIKEGKVGAFKL